MSVTEPGPPTAVVIDGYSAGNFYPAAFTAAGTRVIHVQSTAELIPTMLAPDLTAYAENIVCTDQAELVELLRPYSPLAVVPGQESAVRLADRISEALAVKSNGTALSPARRDKYEMIEALRRAGVRCADQFKSDDVAAVVKWAESRGIWPVVVKPISSAASDGVVVCTGAEEVQVAAEHVLASRNIFGSANTEVLVQSYLEGHRVHRRYRELRWPPLCLWRMAVREDAAALGPQHLQPRHPSSLRREPGPRWPVTSRRCWPRCR